MQIPLTRISVPGHGAEDVLVDDDGSVLTGTEDGVIHRITKDRAVTVGETGGRPLGLEFLPDGRVLVCDAQRGLLAMGLDGAVEELVTEFEGAPLRFCNNAAVSAAGDIWFSDSSTVYGIADWKADFVEGTRTGRLFVRRANGAVEKVLDGLHFANGVALSTDESFVAVAETGARTVVRHWIDGPLAGTQDYLATELPGYPDNISRGSDGLIWVSIASPRDPVVQRLQNAPLMVRRAVKHIPEALQPKPKRTARVQAYDDAGLLIHDLQGDATNFHMATGVREHNGTVWLGSLHEPAIAHMCVS